MYGNTCNATSVTSSYAAQLLATALTGTAVEPLPGFLLCPQKPPIQAWKNNLQIFQVASSWSLRIPRSSHHPFSFNFSCAPPWIMKKITPFQVAESWHFRLQNEQRFVAPRSMPSPFPSQGLRIQGEVSHSSVESIKLPRWIEAGWDELWLSLGLADWHSGCDKACHWRIISSSIFHDSWTKIVFFGDFSILNYHWMRSGKVGTICPRFEDRTTIPHRGESLW